MVLTYIYLVLIFINIMLLTVGVAYQIAVELTVINILATVIGLLVLYLSKDTVSRGLRNSAFYTSREARKAKVR